MSNNEKQVYKSNKLYFSIDKSFMCKLEMTQNLAKRKHNADNQKKARQEIAQQTQQTNTQTVK